MARPVELLCYCCSAALLAAWWGTACANPSASPSTAGAPLQDEADNQENILSQLLGDYDKVKAVSEGGGDCQCKCVVRPLGRSACQRINDGASKPEDFYVVETITSGPECRCSCVAPPSALNPCEGDFRLKKLREADSKDFKLAAIIDMLEGAFYGLDLLKLHSITTKLVGRVEKLEEDHKTQDANEVLQELNPKAKDNSSFGISNDLADIQSLLQRDAAAAYTLTEEKYEEGFLHDEVVSQHIGSDESLHYAPQVPEATKPKSTSPRKLHVRSRAPSRPTIIRGVTYYKAKDADLENDLDEQDELFSGENAIDLLIEDQLLQHNDLLNIPTRKPFPVEGPLKLQSIDLTKEPVTHATYTGGAPTATTTAKMPPLSFSVVPPSVASTPVSTSSVVPPANHPSPAVLKTTAATEVTSVTGSSNEDILWTMKVAVQATTQAPSTVQSATTTRPHTIKTATVDFQAQAMARPGSADTTKAVTSPATASTTTKQVFDEEDIRNSIGQCKDTLSTISRPTIQNTYGRNEGAWMKDPLAKDERIYITNYYYGNTLVEFRNLDSFKQGRWSNSYKLPYSWMGTGHAVYNGSLYYNRAFTRNLIKYDLKQRYVAAWAMLDDIAYEEETPWRWRGHSDVDFAVDENGLWIIYPAINYEGFSQEVIVLSRLNAVDLSTRKETTWRTGLRKNFYGNTFVICGVLYAVDSYNKKNANISYAFDTHTNTQIIPRLLFENEYSYTTQIDYNPKDRLLYAWDNGHQVTYDVIFAY
ncbi:olfactomedin-like protein 2B isoform X2 [Heteronotia binoei]|uniref:olfactomedin-like protein 2B isoform X2 n=1 Tax=Heteronotia binoei TaxID=13085 RepID=UPI0029307E3E|nr:olfactomedin-like protein 2B isoform X2 [Heteronotia binoei]